MKEVKTKEELKEEYLKMFNKDTKDKGRVSALENLFEKKEVMESLQSSCNESLPDLKDYRRERKGYFSRRVVEESLTFKERRAMRHFGGPGVTRTISLNDEVVDAMIESLEGRNQYYSNCVEAISEILEEL